MKSSNSRTFVTEIIEKIDSSEEFRDFHNLQDSLKGPKFALLIKSLNNPILQLYSSYNFKNFIGDMCSDLKYNMKNPTNFEEMLGLFLLFRDFDKKDLLISFDFMERTPIYKTLAFLYKSLSNNEENLTYVLNIQDLLIPILDFAEPFFIEINESRFEASILQEILDLGLLIFRILRLFFGLRSLIAWKALISKKKASVFLLFYTMKFVQIPEIKSPLIEILEFLISVERKSLDFLKDSLYEFFGELWRSPLIIETLIDFDLIFAVFRLSSFLGLFPLDYIAYNRFLKQLRGFLSNLLKNEAKKAKIFKILTPKVFALALVQMKILGKSKENAALEKVFNHDIAILNKIVYLPEVFETLMGFLEELTDYPDFNKEILYIIELFFNEILGLLSQNDWNFAIIKENDYNILKKLIKLIGKSREISYNRQLLDLILYIFTVFSRKSEISNAGIGDLLEIFRILRIEENEETRKIILEKLAKILEFFKADFGIQEIDLLWTLCDILLDVARKDDFPNEFKDKKPEIQGDSMIKSRESVESLINLIKIVLKKNSCFLIELKNNSFFQDLVISLDYRSFEFIGLLLFLLKEEVNFKPNSLHIYCETINKEITRSFIEENIEKTHCLLILIQRVFSRECQGFHKVFLEVFIDNGGVLEKILSGFETLKKKKTIFLGFLRQFISKSEFFKAFFEKNPHFLRNFIIRKIEATDIPLIAEIMAFSYENDEKIIKEKDYFPEKAQIVFPAIIPWIIEENLININKKASFLKELLNIVKNNENNSKMLLNSDFFNVSLEKFSDFITEILEILTIVLRNSQIRLNSMKVLSFLDKILDFSIPEDLKSRFLMNFIEILEKNAFSPISLDLSQIRLFSIPRLRFPETGSLSFFYWFRYQQESLDFPDKIEDFELNLLEISSFGEIYLRVFKRKSSLFLVFLNYPETRLENSIIEAEKWAFLGLGLSKNKEVFVINVFLNGYLTDTRFYVLEKPLEMVFRMLRVDIPGGNMQEKLEIGCFLAFKRNFNENNAISLYLCQEEAGFSLFGDLNEQLLSWKEGKVLDFSNFFRFGTKEIKPKSLNLEEISTNINKNRRFFNRKDKEDGFYINIEDLIDDIIIAIDPKMRLSIDKNEGIIRTFLDDYGAFSNEKSDILKMGFLINSAFEVNANYMNKASEWLHGVFISDSNKEAQDSEFSLKNVLFETGYCEKILRSFKEAKNNENYEVFLVFIEIFKASKLLQRELSLKNSRFKAFLIEILHEKANIIKIEDLFELFSIKNRLKSSKLFMEFLWNKAFLSILNKNQRKNAFHLILTRILAENNAFLDLNISIMRNPQIIETFPRILLKNEISENCEYEILKILYFLIVPINKSLKIDDFALKNLKALISCCFLGNFKQENLEKLLIKADFTQISQKKLDILLEIALDFVEKVQFSEEKASIELNPEYFLKIIALKSYNSSFNLITNTENSTNIIRLLIRNFLLSMKNTNFLIDLANLPLYIRTFQPFFGDSAFISPDILKSLKQEARFPFFIMILNLFLKGFEILKLLSSSCQLLEKTQDLKKILLKNTFSNKDLLFLNELLKKSQGTNEFQAIQIIPEIEPFKANFFEILEFFNENEVSSSYNFGYFESLFKILAKSLNFSGEFYPGEKTRTLGLEILANKLTFLLKKPTFDSLFHLDKLIIQLQREIPEDFTVFLFNKVLENALLVPNDEDFQLIYPQYSQFLNKFLKKILRRNRLFELKNSLIFAVMILNKRDFIENSRKKPRESFLKVLFQKKAEKTLILEYETIANNTKSLIVLILKSLFFEMKEEKEITDFMGFLRENREFFFEGKYEKDDFHSVFLYFLWDGIKSLNFALKTKELLYDFLVFIMNDYRISMKRVLKSSFSNEIAEKIMDLLNNEKSLLDIELFIEKASSLILKTEAFFQPEYQAFLGNISKTIKEDLNNPLIFTSEIKFYETSKENADKIDDSLNFSLKNPNFSNNSFNFQENIEKTLKRFSILERNQGFFLYNEITENSHLFKKNLEKTAFFDFGNDQAMISKDSYTFSHSKRGFSCEKQLIYLKKTPDFVIKEQLSAKINKSPILESFLKKRSSSNKAKKGFSSSSSSEDEEETIDISLELNIENRDSTTKKTQQLISPIIPRKYSQKSTFFLTFLEEFGINNEEYVDECYEIAYLKERESFIDGLLFICKDSIFLILGFYLNEWGLPEEIPLEGLEKSRFLKRKQRENGVFPENPGLHNYAFQRIKGFKRIIEIPKFDIKEMHTKRYWLKPTAIELFTIRKAYFLIFNIYERDSAYKRIIQGICGGVIPNIVHKKNLLLFTLFFLNKSQQKKRRISYKTFTSHALIKLMTPLWKKGFLNNFEYLVLLNMIAGRTYSDLSQYPVFPWVLANYSSDYECLDLLEKTNYRDLEKPIGALTEERAKLAREKFESTSEEKSLFPAFHYGSHYSSAVLVLYYLVRLMPYSKYAINLQGGHFDLSDRLFSNYCETWTLANNLDYKELIPEVYYLPEFLMNINNFDFGKTQTNLLVRDIILPIWSRQEPRFFINFNRKALESVLVSRKLNNWIDLIFGFKQKGPGAIEALNLFYFLTYEDAVDIELYNDPIEKSAILDQINEYGQTPKQLFKKPHPMRKSLEKSLFLGYDLQQLMNIKPNLFLDDSAVSKKINDFYTKLDDFRSMRRSSLIEASAGIRSSRVFSGFLGNLLEQGISSIVSKLNLIQFKTLMKKLLEKQEKSFDYLFMNYKGQSLISIKQDNETGNLRKKLFNWNNAYNCLLLLSQIEKGPEKTIETEVLAAFPQEISNISASTYLNINKTLFLGTKNGLIAIYEYIKDFEAISIRKKSREFNNNNNSNNNSNINNISNNSSQNTKKAWNLTFFLDKDDIGSIFKQNNFYQLNEKKIYIVKKGDYSSLRSQSSFGNNPINKETKEKVFFNANNEEMVRKTRNLALKFLLKGAHFNQILHLKVIKIYLILLSVDIDGIVAFWDIEKATLLRKINIHHYQDLRIYEEIKTKNKEEKVRKSQMKRQKIKCLNVCEETGDFLLISRNYASVYSLNGVLLAIEQIKEQHFSTGLLIKNRCQSNFEELYVITGQKTGILSFWIMKLNENGEKAGPVNRNTDHYANKFEKDPILRKLNVPYKLHCIYRLFTSEYSGLFEEYNDNDYNFNEQLNIERISLSADQRKLYTYHRNKKVLCWKNEEIDQNLLKKCVNCGSNFGILDKKFICSICALNMCVSCSKFMKIVPEISLKEPTKVCEKCFKKESEKKSVSLYDNY